MPPNRLKRLVAKSCNAVDWMNNQIGKCLSFFYFFVTGVMFYEVISRYFFNRPTLWATELSCMVFGVTYVLGGAYLLLHDGHINADILYKRFPARWRALSDVLSSLVAFVFLGVVLWQGGIAAWDSMEIREHSFSVWGPPIYPIKMAIPLGAILFLLQVVVRLVRDIEILFTGKKIE